MSREAHNRDEGLMLESRNFPTYVNSVIEDLASKKDEVSRVTEKVSALINELLTYLTSFFSMRLGVFVSFLQGFRSLHWSNKLESLGRQNLFIPETSSYTKDLF